MKFGYEEEKNNRAGHRFEAGYFFPPKMVESWHVKMVMEWSW